MNILGIGNAIIDVINSVPSYPEEDAELRVIDSRQCLGGNCANTITALALRGHQCHWMGTLADDHHAQTIRQEFGINGIDTKYAVEISKTHSPVSWVTLSQDNGSRTILHHRQLDEIGLEALLKLDINQFDWIHFEGRNVEVIGPYMQYLREQGFCNFSLEVEKSRENLDDYFHLPAILIFSRHFVHQIHAGAIRQFFPRLRAQHVTADLYCGWGKAGGWAMDSHDQLYQQPAWQPAAVVDTLGAGDVFNAAIIDAKLSGKDVQQTLGFACHMAGYKCGTAGFAGLKHFDEHAEQPDD